MYKVWGCFLFFFTFGTSYFFPIFPNFQGTANLWIMMNCGFIYAAKLEIL